MKRLIRKQQKIFIQRKPKRFSGGFTLIELMVSLGLFIVVIMAAVSALYSVNAASRKIEAMRAVLDNLNFAMESMSRTIRTGTNVICGGTTNGSGSNNCTFENAFNSPGDRLSVDSTIGTQGLVEYRWVIDSGTNKGLIQKWSNGDWVSITAPEIDIQRLSFYVDGADNATTGTDDFIQPSVVMLVQGVASVGENIAPFAIQTLVSVRTAEQ